MDDTFLSVFAWMFFLICKSKKSIRQLGECEKKLAKIGQIMKPLFVLIFAACIPSATFQNTDISSQPCWEVGLCLGKQIKKNLHITFLCMYLEYFDYELL